MRAIGMLTLCAAAGCTAWPFAGASSDGGISADAVRAYAKAHDLTREEARRELAMFRDADHLKELRQSEAKKEDQPASPAKTTP